MSELDAHPGVAVVTGGARGLGFAICRALLDIGYDVVVADLREPDAISAARRLSADRAYGLPCDVASDASVDGLIAEVEGRYGRLDVLVNNAGHARPRATHEVSSSEWNEMLEVHLGGTFRCSRAAFPLLTSSGHASIVNISSISAHRAIPGRASYNSAKAAIEAYTRTVAVEWARAGIRVNAVAPGYILTEGAKEIYASGAANYEERRERIPLGRLGEPSEVGEAVAWLASPKSSYVTGQLLVVDGGFLADGSCGAEMALTGIAVPPLA